MIIAKECLSKRIQGTATKGLEFKKFCKVAIDEAH
jgi:hypothetical protein